MLDGSSSGKAVSLTASESSTLTAASTDMVLRAPKAVTETKRESIKVEAEAGNVGGLESPSVGFLKLSSEKSHERTRNGSDCPKGAGDWYGIVVSKHEIDGPWTIWGGVSCSRGSETGFVVSTERNGRRISLTVGVWLCKDSWRGGTAGMESRDSYNQRREESEWLVIEAVANNKRTVNCSDFSSVLWALLESSTSNLYTCPGVQKKRQGDR